MSGLGVDIIVHAVGAIVMIIAACFVYGYIRHCRRALTQVVDIFRATVEASSIVAGADREELRRLIRNVEVGVAGVERLEAAGVLVADDLAASHRRADETDHDQPAGTAADAASRQTTAEAGRP